MNFYFATKAHVKKLQQLAANARLVAPDGFYQAPLSSLRACYNGVGPQAWSHFFRQKITALLEFFEPEALIHDYEYTYLPKSYSGFLKANVRFLRNGIKYAFFLYGKNSIRQF